ncbi:MAG: alpha/beta hydrolase-fold protein [Saprospiraceae bacterium]
MIEMMGNNQSGQLTEEDLKIYYPKPTSAMKLQILSFLLFALLIPSATAQGGLGSTAIVSPEVADDNRVTFRLWAPKASSVKVSGDFGAEAAMQKGENGVWSVTIGPLDPEEYIYYYLLDSVRLLDPYNPRVKVGYVTTTTVSLLEVPAREPAFYDVQQVPHGEIRTHLYQSESNQVVRELTVYVPPGYDENPSKRYPVLYLLHGFANDHHSWHRYGRANDILDNLLARKAIDPFIVVMPLGYGGAHVNGDGTGLPPEGGGFRRDAGLYERDILEDIIPLIEKKYRTIADRKHRAIMGFSMGGGQAGRYGLGNLDMFSYIGIMSAGMGNGTDSEPLKSLAADPEKANEQIDLLWVACGKDDFAFEGAKTFSENLKQIGIKHSFHQTEGEHHWRVWRRYLRDVAPLLFK